MNVLALAPPLFVDVSVGEDDGPAAVPVDFGPCLEDEVVHQVDVAFVEQSVFRLKRNVRKWMFEIENEQDKDKTNQRL